MRLQGGHSPGWNVCSDRPYRTCPSLTTANALDRRLSHCIIRLACHIANRLGPSRTFRAAVHATSAHRQARVVASTSTDEAGEEPALGSAYQSTLQVLEWSRLCRHLASFAQTTLGQRACLSLIPPTDQAGSEALLSDTKAVQALEGEYAVEIEFGGIQTAQASDALRRASRGGMLSGQLLQAVASLIQGMSKLQKAIAVAARQAEATGHTVLEPVVQAFKDLPALPELSGEIGFALQEDGAVREAASDGVKKAAAKVRTVEGRLRGILKGHQGEITEIGGRMCVAVPSTADRPPRGILLGSAPGGSAWYLEPPAAVPLNNDLISARAELTAAEEAVLWRLTGKVSERAAELEAGLKAVVWLDTTAAKARCGRWTGGILPEFVPFPKTGKARGGSKKKATAAAAAKKAEGGEEEESVDDDLSTHFMYLRRLRHPLLLGDRLVAEAQGGWRGGSSASVAPKRQRLPGWRGNRNAPYDATSSSGEDSDAEMSPAALPPVPVPIDVTVASGTRAVIITGPNTGGKTATLKAVGLAVLMAKAGMPVPAADPVQMPCFDAVLADIGDEQSLSASLSTFSGHLRRIEALRKESSSKSLILLDELGTGERAIFSLGGSFFTSE